MVYGFVYVMYDVIIPITIIIQFKKLRLQLRKSRSFFTLAFLLYNVFICC